MAESPNLGIRAFPPPPRMVPSSSPHPTHRPAPPIARRLPDYALAVGVVIVAVGLAFVVVRLLPHANLSLVFLTGVLVVAARAGLGPSLLASGLSLFAYAFIFTLPYHELGVEADSDAATLAFFLIVAAITGHLAVRMHREMQSNRAALARVSKLHEFGARLSSAAHADEVLDALTTHLERSLPGPLVVLLAEGGGTPVPRSCAGVPASPAADEIAVAWANPDRGVSASGGWRFLQLKTNRARLGLVALGAGRLSPEQLELAASLCDQAALALDRIRLVGDLEQARLASETEQLRSALLSSVSHDLRTPLAAIIGSTTSLLEYDQAISPEDRKGLLQSATEEARRLDRYIQNLLDMTRLREGKLVLRRDWVDIRDVVSGAIGRLRGTFDGLHLEVHIAPDIPIVSAQGVLLEQALVNLLDNAARFSPAGGRIEVSTRRAGERVEIEVYDEGPGIPEAERENVFAMFYTLSDTAGSRAEGTGLGLAICRGIAAAHGGGVTAHAGRDGRGTCVRLSLPIIEPD